MKNKFKKNYKFILGTIFGVIISASSVFAASVLTGDKIPYDNTNSKLSSTNVKDAIDEVNTKATTKLEQAKNECPDKNVCTETWAKVGDYVKMTPTSTSYTISKSMTGADSDQTINPSELDLWRVISVNSDGTIEMISQNVSSTSVSFYGKTGYKNFISTLNQIASQYTNISYTVTARNIGYRGQTETITDTTALDARTKAPWTSSTKYTSENSEPMGSGDLKYGFDTENIKKILGKLESNEVGTTTTKSYFLSSRYYEYLDSSYWAFKVCYIDEYGRLKQSEMMYGCLNSVCAGSETNLSIRPIITIESSTPKGSGTSDDPYILN